MDILQLKYFVHVAEMSNFSHAAAFLHVSQPALSRQINALESELKERLLVRNGRGVTLTVAGGRIYEHAKAILQLHQRACDDMENTRLNRTGSVAIGMPGSLASVVSTQLVRKMREELPDAKVHIHTERSIQLQEWLLQGQLDMAVVFDAPISPLIEIHELQDERLYLFEKIPDGETDPQGPPVPLADIADQPLIITSRTNRIRETLESALARAGKKLLVECELDSLANTMALVSEGFGRSVATGRSKRTGTGKGNLRTRLIIEPELVLQVQIIMRTRRLNNKLNDAAFTILRDLCLDILKS